MKIDGKLLIPARCLRMTVAELHGYAAGIIDGEGYIGLSRNTKSHSYIGYHLEMKVAMTATAAVGTLFLLFGGSVYLRQGENNHKSTCIWNLGHQDSIRSCLKLLRGKILVKFDQVELALAYLEILAHSKNVEQREDFYLKFKQLNRKGVNNET